jgi:hypothetical protein
LFQVRELVVGLAMSFFWLFDFFILIFFWSIKESIIYR